MAELVIAINISIDTVDMKEKKKEEMYVFHMITNHKMTIFSSVKTKLSKNRTSSFRK
jgi:hypothetical protein